MIRRSGGQAVYAGPHVGTRGSLASIRHNGPEDFSEGIPEEERKWEGGVRAAMLTREASFGIRWAGDWESWDEPDCQVAAMAAALWGPAYRRNEPVEPPFGRR